MDESAVVSAASPSAAGADPAAGVPGAVLRRRPVLHRARRCHGASTSCTRRSRSCRRWRWRRSSPGAAGSSRWRRCCRAWATHNVVLMCLIFLLAGGFVEVSKAIGAVDAIVVAGRRQRASGAAAAGPVRGRRFHLAVAGHLDGHDRRGRADRARRVRCVGTGSRAGARRGDRRRHLRRQPVGDLRHRHRRQPHPGLHDAREVPREPQARVAGRAADPGRAGLRRRDRAGAGAGTGLAVADPAVRDRARRWRWPAWT